MKTIITRISTAAAAAKSLQSCPTLCDPIHGSPSGSPVPGILQARTLEWAAISFSNVWNWKVKVKSLSRVRLLAAPWTAGHQAPPSIGFSRQEYWNGAPVPSPKCPGSDSASSVWSIYTMTGDVHWLWWFLWDYQARKFIFFPLSLNKAVEKWNG